MRKMILSLGLVLSSQFALQAQTVSDELVIHDTRSQNEVPTYFKHRLHVDFKERSTIGVPGWGGFSANLTIAPWSDVSGGLNHQLNFNNGGIFYRTGSHDSSAWNPWRKLAVEEPDGTLIAKNLFVSDGSVGISGSGNEGNALSISNSSKTQVGAANEWKIYNMTGFYGNSLQFWAYDYAQGSNLGCLILSDNGNVGIGTWHPANKLEVNGTIRAKEVKVETGWSDFVFNDDYNLRPLSEVSDFIQENKHLPEIPTATEVETEGVNLGEMQTKLLQKVEELTLYLIQQDNTIRELQEKIKYLESK